ncbi:MAG TPA: potassium channel family protein [Armatimonadota bacterium]|jgi:hypothetical protein
MEYVVGALACLLILFILWDTFETVIMPRTVINRMGLTTVLYRVSWRVWGALASRLGARRERFLSAFGPLSLILLLATWAVMLMLAFAMLHWSAGSRFVTAGRHIGFGTYVYVSGTTLFTLGLGDVTPVGIVARSITVLEAGLGLGFLAVVIGYLPVQYQAFSRREVTISLLDARAGSPATATELLRRHAAAGQTKEVTDLLREFERWSAEVLESHLSYPTLAYYRSQHDRQSWLSSLTTVLDTSALVAVGVGDIPTWQAELTLAMARHTVVDLALVFYAAPAAPFPDRLPSEDFDTLSAILAEAGIPLRDPETAELRLLKNRRLYEPYVAALAKGLRLDLPTWIAPSGGVDNWQTSFWDGGHL